jgi:hypothetical protein
MKEDRPLPRIGLWALVLGGVGFAAGFFGPMALRPDANQGPMVGIFITGPGGALLGLVLGTVFRFLPVTNARRFQALAVTATALAIGTLYACLPSPETLGVLFTGTVQSCQSPAELTGAAVRDWEKRIADAPWAKVRAGWRQEVAGMLGSNTGVVLTIEVQRQDRILRHRKPWNAGRLSAEGWRSTQSTERYFADFAGDSCADYPRELPTLYVKYGQGSGVWPPDDLANFLNLATIDEAPTRYLQLTKP